MKPKAFPCKEKRGGLSWWYVSTYQHIGKSQRPKWIGPFATEDEANEAADSNPKEWIYTLPDNLK